MLFRSPDGTGVRDYIHVVDLADGHVAALGAIAESEEPLSIWNLGTGQGYSVLDMVKAFERVNGIRIPYRIAARRDGDVASCFASRSEEHTSELQSLMRISSYVFCLKK